MTDFASRVRRQGTDYIVRSLMDVDFYKFTMGYFIHKYYAGTDVKFGLINRDKTIPLGLMIDEQELRDQLDYVRTLKFRRTDLYYLRGMDVYGKNMFSEEYIQFLAGLQLPPYNLEYDGENINLTFQGPWESVTFWETIAMAIISELYYRHFEQQMSDTELRVTYGNATNKLYSKLKIIRDKAPGAKIADFGLRRRHSFMWQKFAIEMAKDVLGDNFTGTSNTWLAFNQDLVPIGTNAHELPMVVTATYPDQYKADAQYDIIRKWGDTFNNGLKIVLPDTYGTKQFFEGMPADLCQDVVQNWRGMRQDSGSPDQEAQTFMNWCEPMSYHDKVCIFSDGLDYDDIVRLHNRYQGKLITPFGWGTMLTNDFIGCDPDNNLMYRPFSMVCKVQEANGKPAVKLSNNPDKATGPKDEVEKYKKIFGVEGHNQMKVTV